MILIAALLTAALIPASRAAAQGSGDVDPMRVDEAIAKTDEVIAEAREVVRDSRSQKARTVLDYAVKLQDRAKNSSAVSNMGMAYQLTRQARTEAWHAINLARTAARQDETTRRLGEHTSEKLIMLRARIAETGLRDERVMRLMIESQSMLEKARVNYQQLRGELALKLTEGAFRLANQAEDRFRRSHNLMEMCQRRLALLERLSERARAQIDESGDKRTETQLRRAEDMLARARNSYSAGRYEACRMNIENAGRILRSMIRNTERVRAGDPENMLEEARRLERRAMEMIGSADGAGGPSSELMGQAGRMLDSAEEELTGGDPEKAVRLIEQARKMLRNAVEQARADIDPERASEEIERATEMGETVRATVERCEAEGAGNLFERANEHLVRARENLDRGERERALAEARIARNLFNRIREICAR
jgi:HEPN domain-containing protein